MIGAALLGCAELVVCDQCWHLAGGMAAVRAKLAGDDERLQPLLVFPPEVEALLAGANEHDRLHPVDRLLVESGVRWTVLRHIAVPARMELARWVLERTPSPATRPADSPDVWMAAVEACIHERSGTEFKYKPKRQRWWHICNVLRHCADRDRRPLAWVTQEEIAAAVGCSTRTVRRCVAWLRGEGLLFEVVPGCQLPQQVVPDSETARERAARRQAMAEAIAAEEAAIVRARAELDAGSLGGQAVETAHLALSPELAAVAANAENDGAERPLVRLAPVYELRLPHSPAERAETALTSANMVGLRGDDQNGHPPKVSYPDQLKSRAVHPVDNRRAPRGSDREDVPAAFKKDQHRSRQSEAVCAAHWLLHTRLDPRICDEVSLRWLAAQIRGSHLLDRHEWTWDDLADQLHGYPEYTHLPHYIRDCRAWIRARIARANPHLSPTKLRIIQHVERHSPALRRRRQAEAEHTRRADIARRRTAINACDLCDEQGWLHMPAGEPTARCTHQRSTSGW